MTAKNNKPLNPAFQNAFKDAFEKLAKTGEPQMLLPGKPGYKTTIELDGSITYTKIEANYDPNGKATIVYE